VDTALKYRAFLSYGHRDIGWAKWLHGRLEGFRFDKDLVGRDTPFGPVPKTLRPVFRDREDFSGGHTLTEATVSALDASASLIVLCSPVAASRPAVNEEVRLFRSRHPDRPVIPVIIEGTWPENFPPALRFELAKDGSVTDRPMTVLGPDLRDSADGKNLGLAKAIAGLTGLGADDIFRRAERARRRRTRIWAGIAGLCGLLAIMATGSAVYAWDELKTNEAFLNATLKTATDIVNTAVAQAEKYNVPRAATLELLTRAEGLFDDMARYGRPTPELRFQKALMLIQFARNYAILGDTGKERADAEAAYVLLAGLAAAKPDDNDYQSGLAGADEEIGDVHAAHGDLAGALKSYRDGLAIIGRLAQSDPGNASRQHDLAVSSIKVGDALRAQGDLAAALQSYRDSLAIFERLAQSDPGVSFWQRELSVSYERVGDVQEAQGDLSGALKSFRDNLAIAQRLAQSDPGNAGWQRDLSVSYMAVGGVQQQQGDLAGALQSYQADLAIAQRLAQADPDNSLWQHDLALMYGRIADVRSAQNDLAGALKSYRDSLAIFERLAQSDPSNTGWQRDLALSDIAVGNTLAGQNDFAGALKSFRDSLVICQRLVSIDPGNKQWRDDLVLVTAQIAGLLVMTHDFAAALVAADQAIALAPDMIALYLNRADALMFLGRTEEARALYLKYRGQKDVLNGKSWESVVLDDFAELRKAGLANPLMDEIEKDFSSAG
jgi:tetratricopeptide (TPR) repeat protein